jgi:hypothetical protein
MKKLGAKKITATIVLVLIVGAISWKLFYRPQPIRSNEPQKTVQEILQERSLQAGTHLVTPLGKAFVNKNWTEFNRLFNPATQFQELAEILRAAFIENTFQNFNLQDMDAVLLITVNTIDQLTPKTQGLSGLLITQYFRLPIPQHTSPAYQKILEWANIPKPKDDSIAVDFRVRNGLFKLLLQDLNPPTTVVQAYLAGILGDTDHIAREEWLRKTDDIRSVPLMKKCVEYISQHYAKFDQRTRPAALLVLSRHPEIETANLVKYTIDAYQKDTQDYFEAALRATKPLLDHHALNEKQKIGIEKKLEQIPESYLTPFVRAKTSEIKQSLSIK